MFHVEIRRSFRHARAFNLDDNELRPLVEAWMRGDEVLLGDRRWDPAESTLTVLEGPRLSSQQLAFGQGWQSAVKSAGDVTAQLLQRHRGREVAVLAQTAAGMRFAAGLVEELGLRPVRWSGADVDTALVVLGDAPELSPAHAFDAGVVIGRLGPRAVLVDLGAGDVPEVLRAQRPVRLDPDDPQLDALVERLRSAGA